MHIRFLSKNIKWLNICCDWQLKALWNYPGLSSKKLI